MGVLFDPVGCQCKQSNSYRYHSSQPIDVHALFDYEFSHSFISFKFNYIFEELNKLLYVVFSLKKVILSNALFKNYIILDEEARIDGS